MVLQHTRKGVLKTMGGDWVIQANEGHWDILESTPAANPVDGFILKYRGSYTTQDRAVSALERFLSKKR